MYSIWKTKTCMYKQSSQPRSMQIIYSCRKIVLKTIFSQLTQLFLWICAHFRPYFEGGNVSPQGSGIKSVSTDDSSLKLLELEPTTQSITSLCESLSTLESDKVICCCTFLNRGLSRLLTFHKTVQQAPKVGFDHCDLFSFLSLKGDLVIGKVQWKLVDPQGWQLARVVQSNPLSVIVLTVQPFHSLQSPLSFLCSFLSRQGAQHPGTTNSVPSFLANIHNSHKLLYLTSWNYRIHHKHISLLLSLEYPCPSSGFHHTITCHARWYIHALCTDGVTRTWLYEQHFWLVIFTSSYI